jgi:brefeldin A-resistance guanine nucleotide exchange factor 1
MSNGAADTPTSGHITDSPRGPDTSFKRETVHNSYSKSYSNGAMARTVISVAVDPVALITTECITVTSAMRKNPRWAHSSVSAILGGGSSPSSAGLQGSRPSTPRDDLATRKGNKNRPVAVDAEDGGLANRWGLRGKKGKSMQDNPLMAGFGRLRQELNGCKGMGCYMMLAIPEY